MHHLLPGPQALRRDPPARGVLTQARHVVRAGLHALVLHPEDVDDVRGANRVDVRRHLRVEAARQQRRRADERAAHADELERLNERARDAAVQDVADDRDMQPFEPAELLLQRVEVEQRLRRMLVRPVARVDDVCTGDVRDELRRADVRVADDDHVRVVGSERERCVLQRLALVDGRARGLQRHRVGREPLRSELEARRRARRGLVEEIHDEAALQRRQLLQLAIERRGERAGGAEQALDVVALEVGDREQMPARRRARRPQLVLDETD